MSDQQNKKIPSWLQLCLIIGIPIVVFLALISFYMKSLVAKPISLSEKAPETVVGKTATGQTNTGSKSGTSSSSEQFNLETDISTSKNGETMKTIADFAPIKGSQATIHTNVGDITVDLYQDKAPLTVTNFLTLISQDFYNGIKFHRVIEDFMAQTGDPNSRAGANSGPIGTGGPGYAIKDEFDASLKHDAPGILSMANSGPNSGGSQFFITFGATPWLDGKHAVFGKVADPESLKVLMSISTSGQDEIKSIDFK